MWIWICMQKEAKKGKVEYELFAASWDRGEQNRAEAEARTKVAQYNFKLLYYQTDELKQANKQTNIQTKKQTKKQANKQTDKQTNKSIKRKLLKPSRGLDRGDTIQPQIIS